jgi:hypothetical protein
MGSYAGVLSVSGAPQLAVPHEIVEHDLARRGSQLEQSRGLFELQAESRHLAVGSDDHRNEMTPVGPALDGSPAHGSTVWRRDVGYFAIVRSQAVSGPHGSLRMHCWCIAAESTSRDRVVAAHASSSRAIVRWFGARPISWLVTRPAFWMFPLRRVVS